MHMLHMWHIYAHKSPYTDIKYLAYVAYMPNLVGIFGSGTYLAITCRVKVAVACVLEYTKFLGPHAHVTFWLRDVDLECCIHICSVMYVKYVYSAPGCLIDASDFICGIYMCAC